VLLHVVGTEICGAIWMTSEYVYKIEFRNDMKDDEKRGIGEYEGEGNLAWERKRRRLKGSRWIYKIYSRSLHYVLHGAESFLRS
jgi:hypothetical protein